MPLEELDAVRRVRRQALTRRSPSLTHERGSNGNSATVTGSLIVVTDPVG